ncbi:RiPP maturation radical SAM C-methyltransferase [Thermopolyspora sp. NPDC052614]|uniref:RiPP maturation radical SAM C-methyltransferase n=1 Tax=Thermopolyspora sp. NPDC052614 TaxID=3155682 RepID=UPI00342E7AC7
MSPPPPVYPRVLLLSMPWHALDRPSLGLSLLQAGLLRDGFACDVRYLGFRLADRIGSEDYQWITDELPTTAFAGDWLFTPALYGERPDADADYAARVLGRTGEGPGRTLDRLRRLRAHCEPFLDDCLRSIAWQDYDVVGFTSTFEQNIASLALARRVKRLHPRLVIVFGGANWEGEMGHELHARFPFVDVVCSGEGDVTFPAFLRRLRKGADPATVPGLVLRRGGASVRTPPAPPIGDLDRLPFPRFDAYLADHAASASVADIPPELLLETSRGCWWGERRHCTFCGLNGGTMTYRAKSPGRVLAEIEYLRGRHGATAASVVDNILDMRYFGTLLPALAAAGAPMDLFYEVKANLTAAQVRMLAAAGIRRIQPGLESLSDHVLSLMRKGTTALRNIQLLKWCREFGVRPEWNLLYGFPGETPEDYEGIRALIDSIDFLQPPGGVHALRLDRFSPYHADPAAFGLVNVRPMAVYRHLYPFPEPALRRIACFFDYDRADGVDPLSYAAPALDRVREWIRTGPRGTLALLRHVDGHFVLLDSRGGRTTGHPLPGWRSAVYLRCDRVTGERAAVATGAAHGADAEAVRAFLAECRDRRLMAGVGGQWLALGVRSPARMEPDDL